jgi:manganese/zinc/iron transport system permease protein
MNLAPATHGLRHTLPVRVVLFVALPAVILALAAYALIRHGLVAPALAPAFEAVGLGAYNTRVVVLGTMLLGAVSGVVGSFALLRKRALIGDVLSHAMLPGIGLAFLFMVAAGGTGKAMGGLLAGAVVFGLLGVGCVLAIRHGTRLKEDAALGIVLSVFFGLGIVILGLVMKTRQGNAAGLETFIYGKTASMVLADAERIAIAATVACWLSVALFKEFAVLCFDESFAGAQGWSVLVLDTLMMVLITTVAVVGMQAVGLILVVALLIIPAAAARFWTDRLSSLVGIAAGIGAGSGLLGAGMSAGLADWPAGASIVVVASGLFFASMLFGVKRGVIRRLVEREVFRRRIARQHLLRALYETTEGAAPVTERDLLRRRSWSRSELRRLLRAAARRRRAASLGAGRWTLTDAGRADAARLTRNHRLWELYLITHADIAPSHVDRDADQIEHVLGSDLVAELEAELASTQAVPPSPHALDDEAGP